MTSRYIVDVCSSQAAQMRSSIWAAGHATQQRDSPRTVAFDLQMDGRGHLAIPLVYSQNLFTRAWAAWNATQRVIEASI